MYPLSTQSYFAAVEVYRKELAEFEAALDSKSSGKKTVQSPPAAHKDLPPPYPEDAAAAAVPTLPTPYL